MPLLPLLLLPLLLFSCATQPQTTVVIRHEVSLEEIKKMCFRSTYGSKHHPFGCAYWKQDSGKCDIYVPAKSEYTKIKEIDSNAAKLDALSLELLILGHETKHCFDGAWH